MEQEDIIKLTEQLYGSSFLQNSIRDYLSYNEYNIDYDTLFGGLPKLQELRVADKVKPTTLKNGLPNNWDDEDIA